MPVDFDPVKKSLSSTPKSVVAETTRPHRGEMTAGDVGVFLPCLPALKQLVAMLRKETSHLL